jgi:hypothetical protein
MAEYEKLEAAAISRTFQVIDSPFLDFLRFRRGCGPKLFSPRALFSM